MKFQETDLKGSFVIQPQVFEDERGYFFESFHQLKFEKQIGYRLNFVQDNESRSGYGVVRGLHIQRDPSAQAKLIRAVCGKILDVIVDVRNDSPTYGQHFSIELSSTNKNQLFVPVGFLHGFSVLSETAVVNYKCSSFYQKESEDGVYPFDETLQIDWKIPKEAIILSDKDNQAQAFQTFMP